MKKILDQIPTTMDNVFGQFAASTQRAANGLRWWFGAFFVLATLWSLGDDSAAKLIYLVVGLLWLLLAALTTLRASAKLAANGIALLWLDLAIISFGLMLCAWLGVYNTKGWILFLSYFPVLALTARRYNILLVLQCAAFIFLFYALLSLWALGSLVLPRLLMIVAMTVATLALARKPRQEVVATAQDAVREAYQAGASDKEAELTAFVHAQSFPPPQYDLPGLYAAYKHGVGTKTSGDFYAAFETASGPMIVVGDMPGAGLHAAMAATDLQRQITKLAREKSTLVEIATAINTRLHRKNQMVGCVFARWEGTHLHYLNAGHLPVIHISKREPKQLPLNALPLGTREDNEFIEEVIEFQKGDLLLLYTDGAYAGLASDYKTGAAEIFRLTDQFSGGEVNTICHRVFDCGQPEYVKPDDDSTVVIVRRQEYASEAAA
jgi:hypothetical protein